MGGQVGLVNSPEKGNEVTWLSVCVDFGADSKGQQFLKTFYAGCVKVCVWGVIIDFVALALNHPPPPHVQKQTCQQELRPCLHSIQ